jgi:hypothetical protein
MALLFNADQLRKLAAKIEMPGQQLPPFLPP